MGVSMIIDAHVHIGSWKKENKDYGFDERKVKELLKRLGIDKACILPIAPPELFQKEDVRRRDLDNQRILEICEREECFIPIYWFNPFKPEECRRALESGFKGLKYHPDLHLLPISDEKLESVLKIAREYEVPVFVHTSEKSSESSIFRVHETAERYPDIVFFALHSIDSFSATFYKAKEKGLYELDNIYYCIGGRSYLTELKFIYDNVGAEHIVFSSDLPFGHPAIFLKYVELLTDDEKERKMILGENIKRILKI